jgi:hypothetical protein
MATVETCYYAPSGPSSYRVASRLGLRWSGQRGCGEERSAPGRREDAVFMGRDGKKGKGADLLTFLLQNRTVIITIW